MLEEAHERDLVPVLLADVGKHDVGRGADERAVAAQASAQRQRPPQGRAVQAIGLERQDDRDHRGHERDVVQETGDDGRTDQHRQHGDEQVAARDVDEALRQHGDNARLGHGADDDEQAREEAQRGPFDAVQRLFNAFAGNEHDDAGGGQRDDARLQAQLAMRHEADDHERDHDVADLEQARVLDVLVLVKLHDGLTMLLGGDQLLAVHETERDDDGGQDDDNGRRVVHDEVGERVARGRADHDVGRVADERRRAADVRRHDFGEEVRHRVDVEQAAHGDGHRADQKNGGHVVQERRKNSGEQDEQNHDGPWVALRRPRAFDGEKFEHAGLLDHGDEQHHAQKHAERVEVDMRDRDIERHDVQDEQEHCAHDGDERAVHLLGHDDDHGHHEDCDGDDLASIHDPPPSTTVCSRGTFFLTCAISRHSCALSRASAYYSNKGANFVTRAKKLSGS